MSRLGTAENQPSSTLSGTLPVGKYINQVTANPVVPTVTTSGSQICMKGFNVAALCKPDSAAQTYLEDSEQFPTIVHMILTFVIEKEPEENE